MKPLTLEYIAGFVDGEGSFMINKGSEAIYKPSFSIANTDPQILRDIQNYLDLGLKISISYPKNPKWKACYHLVTCNTDQVKSVAELLHPHLRMKKEQAEIIMQWPRGRHINIGQRTQPDYSTKALQLKLRNRIMALNKRGRRTQESNRDPELQPDPQLGLFHNNKRR